MTLRPAARADLPRIVAIRQGVSENRLADSSAVSEEEVLWYLDEGIFLVSEDVTTEVEPIVQGFVCANHQTGYVWALFVDAAAQGFGHGSALLAAALDHLQALRHRQAFLTTERGSRAETFYARHGFECMGPNRFGETVYVKRL